MALIRGTEEIGKGNLDFKINSRVYSELKELTYRFNLMSEELHSAQAMIIEKKFNERQMTIAGLIQECLIPHKPLSFDNIDIT